MTHKTVHELENVADIRDMLYDTIACLKGFGNLIGTALERASCDFSAQEAYGIHLLLDLKIQDLDHIHSALMKMLETAPESKAAPAVPIEDIELISRLSGVHKSGVARVLFVLSGTDLAGENYKRENDFGSYRLDRHLLERRTYDTLNNVVEWNRVCTETGQDIEQVKAIFNAMMRYTPASCDVPAAESDETTSSPVERVIARLENSQPSAVQPNAGQAVNG